MDAFANRPEIIAQVAHRSSLNVSVRASLWVVGFIVALGICLQWGQGTGVHNDFTQNVWLPARLVLDGHNPYFPSRSHVDTALGEYSVEFTRPNPRDNFNSGGEFHFIYPLWIALVLSPFAAIPLAMATALWRALNLVLLVWGVGAVLRATNPTFRPFRPQALAAIGVTVLLCVLPTFRESFVTLYHGQFSIIELGLLAAVWGWLVSSARLAGRQRASGDVLAGVALAALATKPQVVGLAVVLIGLWALSRKRFVIPVAAISTLALLLLVPNVFYSWSLPDWLRVVFGGQAGSQAEVSASVWGLSYQWMGASSPWKAVATVLSLVGIAALLPRWWGDFKDRTSPVPVSLPLTLCMNSVISPYLLGYEDVALLMPALVLLALAGLPGEQTTPEEARNGKRWRFAVYAWLAVLPAVVLAMQAISGLEYPAIVQSLAMLALWWVAKPQWKWDTK